MPIGNLLDLCVEGGARVYILSGGGRRCIPGQRLLSNTTTLLQKKSGQSTEGDTRGLIQRPSKILTDKQTHFRAINIICTLDLWQLLVRFGNMVSLLSPLKGFNHNNFSQQDLPLWNTKFGRLQNKTRRKEPPRRRLTNRPFVQEQAVQGGGSKCWIKSIEGGIAAIIYRQFTPPERHRILLSVLAAG